MARKTQASQSEVAADPEMTRGAGAVIGAPSRGPQETASVPITPATGATPPYSIMIVGQAGRLQYEALLFMASLVAHAPALATRVHVAEPQPGPKWERDPRMRGDVAAQLREMGATIAPFESVHFGQSYPYGNKIEGLAALPPGPFVFFDTDTLVTGDLGAVPFDFARPSASMRRTGTWPEQELYWPGYTRTWKSLYALFGLDFETSLDRDRPDEHWTRYLYFNAGWFFGADPAAFGARFLDYALRIRDETPEELVLQSLDPWLDQVALPLVIHSFGGGRPGPELAGLDGDVTCHYRTFPLLYARESDRVIKVLEDIVQPNKIKKLVKSYTPLQKMVLHKQGDKVRALFDQNDLPRFERTIRNRIRAEGYWMR